MTSTDAAVPGEKTFMGHPRGLVFLSMTEVWERFSFYGMQALLMTYMVDQVLTRGHIETVIGIDGFRAVVEGVFGPLSTQALASQIFGLYTGLVYLTPLIGGWLGDQVLGQRRTVILGGVLMALGHLLMAFEASFLIAMALLILGSGCLKGNISAQVGALYPKDDPRRTPAFSLFVLAINIGGMVAPVACALIAAKYGKHYGFGLAAVGMLVGLAFYISGRRHLPLDTLTRGESRPKLERADTPILLALGAALLLGTLYNIAYAQEFNVFNLWAREYTDLHILSYEMPVEMYPSFDGFFIVALTPLAIRYWGWQVARGKGTSELAKIGWSGLFGALGMLCLVAASIIAAGGGKPGVGWGIACFGLFAWGFIYNYPTVMALCSRVAPPALTGLIMGFLFLIQGFGANYAAGILGMSYEKMTPANFWGLHAAISLAGAVLVLLLYRPLSRVLAPAPAA